jgi:hypothetical protein
VPAAPRPPRRLTLAVVALLAAWACVNLIWLHAAVARHAARQLAKRSGGPLPALVVVKLAARSLGGGLVPNLLLLFLPVARGSPLLQALGLDYGDAIRRAGRPCRGVPALALTLGSALSAGLTRSTTQGNVFPSPTPPLTPPHSPVHTPLTDPPNPPGTTASWATP